MMAHGIRAEELTIQRVGKPGERMPVLCCRGGQGPGKRLPGHSSLYVRVFRNVILIVHVQERIARGATVNGCGSDGEAEARNEGKIGMLSIHLVGVIVASGRSAVGRRKFPPEH